MAFDSTLTGEEEMGYEDSCLVLKRSPEREEDFEAPILFYEGTRTILLFSCDEGYRTGYERINGS